MFQLIATILALGVTEPTAVLKNHTAFATEAACMNYFDTDIGAKDKMQLDAMIARATEETGTTYKIELKCVEQKSSDNGI
jgi:hypothetical protein